MPGTGEPESIFRNGRFRELLGKSGFSISTFGVGIAFAALNTYVLYQIQTIAYLIGHEEGKPPGKGCSLTATSCYVPFSGSGDLNLTTFLLYLNALAFAITGALILLLAGIGDHLGFLREQYVVLLVIYGVLCLPVASLRSYDLDTFTTLSGIYVAFNIVGFVSGALMNTFIPLIMYPPDEPIPVMVTKESKSSARVAGTNRTEDTITRTEDTISRPEREKQGVSMSVWGSVGMNASQVILYCVGIGLTYTSATYGGLYLTTASGAICSLCSILAWRLLPTRPRSTAKRPLRGWLSIPLRALKELVVEMRAYPEAFKFLVAYTIYVDTLLTFGSVTSQIFNLNIRPTALEFTIYSLSGTISSTVTTLCFGILFPYGLLRRISLLRWTIFSYATAIFCAVWCVIGISDSAQVGMKHQWEFYFIQVIQNIGVGITNASFRVLYAELFPKGKEVQYYGFQVVLSCCTAWIPNVVNGPIVEATGLIRLPAALSAAVFLLSVAIGLWTNDEKGIRDVADL